MIDINRVEHQLGLVLEGKASLMAAADEHGLNIERLEAQIAQILNAGLVLTGDKMLDIILASYMIGREQQWVATFTDLLGQEAMQSMLNQVRIKNGFKLRELASHLN